MTKISAKEFDQKFETGEDISEYLEIDKAESPGMKLVNVSLELPLGMIELIDKAAAGSNLSREELIKKWIVERLKEAE